MQLLKHFVLLFLVLIFLGCSPSQWAYTTPDTLETRAAYRLIIAQFWAYPCDQVVAVRQAYPHRWQSHDIVTCAVPGGTRAYAVEYTGLGPERTASRWIVQPTL